MSGDGCLTWGNVTHLVAQTIHHQKELTFLIFNKGHRGLLALYCTQVTPYPSVDTQNTCYDKQSNIQFKTVKEYNSLLDYCLSNRYGYVHDCVKRL